MELSYLKMDRLVGMHFKFSVEGKKLLDLVTLPIFYFHNEGDLLLSGLLPQKHSDAVGGVRFSGFWLCRGLPHVPHTFIVISRRCATNLATRTDWLWDTAL